MLRFLHAEGELVPFFRRRIRRARRRGLIAGAALGSLAHHDHGIEDDHTKALQRLTDLRDRGAINEEEFQREKRRILDEH
jgi:hypothetical protein